jgi:hypothetical protein
VSDLASKSLRRFSPVCPQNRWLGFFGLGLKTGSSGLVIYASKSSRQFLGLSLKTKQTLVYRLYHKTDEGKTVCDMRRDLQLASPESKSRYGFSVWPQYWRMRDDEWCTWHHHEGCVGIKLKIDGSIRRTASDPATLTLSFSMY